MSILDTLAEQRIAVAEARGALRGLPGSGQPQDLDEDPLVPAETRLFNRILKNAGFVPPAVEQMKETNTLRQALAQALRDGDAVAQRRLHGRLLALDLALESARGQTLLVPTAYQRKVAERLAGE
ncbi:MAG: DUF1992 domain-containing protein [Zoogloeaceae bacterium]|jgi:hypothetical protein|nr:DUF1992 domain-containing protein [Zoogloeaceae bacterium]